MSLEANISHALASQSLHKNFCELQPPSSLPVQLSVACSSLHSLTTNNNNNSHSHPLHCSSACHSLVEQILSTVSQLEHTLIEDHQHDYKLRTALENQRDKVNTLRSSLENEKQRNHRLVQLIRGVDSASSTDDELAATVAADHAHTGASGDGLLRKRSGLDVTYESISPLLLQQRCTELTSSNKQCRRHLLRKEKQLKLSRCENEEFQAKYDDLLDEYRSVQQRFEELCCKYLRLQSKKNQEIQKLKDALNSASECILSAERAIDQTAAGQDTTPTVGAATAAATVAQCDQQFRQNLQLFVQALRQCDWLQKQNSTLWNTCTASSAVSN